MTKIKGMMMKKYIFTGLVIASMSHRKPLSPGRRKNN